MSAGPIVGIVSRIWDAGFPRWLRWRASRRIENRVHVAVTHCEANIESSDRGRVSFNLRFSNFSNKRLTVDHIEIDHWRLGYSASGFQSSLLRASGGVDPRSIGSGSFAISLQSADIRDITKGIGPAGNLKSSPQAQLEMRGLVAFRDGHRPVNIPFAIEGFTVRTVLPHDLSV